MGKLFVLLGILTSFVYAEELTVLVTPAKKVYQLRIREAKQGSVLIAGGFEWAPVDATILGKKQFEGKPGLSRTTKGPTQIFKDEQQNTLVRLGNSGKESPVELQPLGNDRHYVMVQRDFMGNLWCETSDGGYSYQNLARNFTNTPEEVEYAARLPKGTKLVANPTGDGAFFLSEDGLTLHYISPPAKFGDDFENVPIPLKAVTHGPVKRLLIAAAGEHNFLAALTTNGTLGWLHFRGSPIEQRGIDFMPVGWPQGIAAANVELKTSFETAPLLTKALTVYNGGGYVIRNLGDDRVIWRDGKMVRVDRHGANVPEPTLVFRKLAVRDTNDPLFKFFSSVNQIYNDGIARDEHFGEPFKYLYREEEVRRLLEILTRTTGNHPVLAGDLGIGRSTIGAILTKTLMNMSFAPGTRMHSLFNNAVVIETTPSLMSKVGGAPTFFRGVRAAREKVGRPIIVVVNQTNEMSEGEFLGYQAELNSDPSLLSIAVTNHSHLSRVSKKNDEFAKHFEVLRLLPLTDAQTRHILNTITIPELAQLYRTEQGPAEITAEAVDTAMRRADQIHPQLGYPEGPRRLLEDMVIQAQFRAGEAKKVVVDQTAARLFIKNALGLPFDPDNEEEFNVAIEKMRAELKDEVVEQPAVIDWLVNSYRDVLRPNAKRRHRTGLFLGPTGSGKTFSLMTAFKKFFRSEKRILEIDCTKYLEKEALTALLGSWPGYVGSEKLGVLPAFLSGNGKNFNGIIFNEWEKASKELANAVMEMMATGKLIDNQGNEFYLGTSLIGLTSNKGDQVFFPRDAKLTRAEQEARRDKATSDDVKQRFLEPDPHQRYETKNIHTAANMQRIDAAFYMLPPSEAGVKKLLRQATLPDIEKELEVKVDLDESVLNAVVTYRFVPEFGVREPKRALEDLIRQAADGVKLPKAGERRLLIAMTGDEARPAMTVAVAGGQSATLPVNFVPPNGILLEDPKVRAQISTLRTRLGAQVFGQEVAIDVLAKSVINQRYVDPDPSRPGVAAFLGPTGTGKSELAEVLGEVEFGDRSRTRSFQMGNIKSMDDVDNLFGTARGRAGSDGPGEFEEFLMKYPEGGVLHFEEMGNVGADDPRVRMAVFRILYSILEGRWTNAMGQTYNTSKFFVVFSSNEGQELMAEAPVDDLRMAVYNRSKSQEFMRKLLEKSGWPQALLGRMQGNLIMFKPLIKADRTFIAGKFFDGLVKKLKRRYPVQVETDLAFLSSAAETFFSHEQGARAIRDFIETEVKAAFGTLVNHVYEKFGDQGTTILRDSKITFKLVDNYAGKDYFTGERPDDRKVMLRIELRDANNTLLSEYESNVTELAPERRLVSKKSLLQVAYHEVGHVVGNVPHLTGTEPDHVTIIGKGEYGGYARPIAIPGAETFNRETAIALLVKLFGARVTETFAGYKPDAGWSQDLRMARDLATRCVTKYGLTDRALSLPLKQVKDERTGEITNVVDMEAVETKAEISRLLNDGYRQAVTHIKSHWVEIRLLTHVLFKKQSMDRAEIKAVLEKARSKEYTDGLSPAQKVPKHSCGEVLNEMGLKEDASA